jgi:integrase
MQSLADEKVNLSSYDMFAYSIGNELTRKYYERRLNKFFDYIGFDVQSDLGKRCNSFAERGRIDREWALNQIISFLQFQKGRVQGGEIAAATLKNFVKAIKLFCEMSDVHIPWKKITRGLPRARAAANDRAPTIEEIQKLVQYPDRRIKAIIYIMASSGIRLGAWDYLLWKHITPITNQNGELSAARIIVYAGDFEEYYTFITPEAFLSLKDWMEFRASYGEKITGDSFLMRDLWQTTNIDYGAKWGLATHPKKLKSSGIKRLIERGLWEQGIRQPLLSGARRHEWKAAHGFRKLYKTRAEQVMRPINVEITMGHNIGLSASYYKPTEQEVLQDYLKAVEFLTINHSNRLQEKIVSLEKKQDDIAHLKLQHTQEMNTMREEVRQEVKLQMRELITRLKPEIVSEGLSFNV